jgi:hypothetical protein
MRMHALQPVMFMVIALSMLLGGCVERRVWIDSEPQGALVWLNDAQVGRTPVDVSITHGGTYDLRLEKEGFEPLMTPATTEGPVWDVVPIDFVVEILPVKARSETRWKFTLEPRNDSEEALVERAAGLRDRLRGDDAAAPGGVEAAPGGAEAAPGGAEAAPGGGVQSSAE